MAKVCTWYGWFSDLKVRPDRALQTLDNSSADSWISSLRTGRYIVLNQYIWYPVGCIVTCCVWIAYIASIRHMQYSGRPERVTWWITLHPCPAFFHLYITSFIVIGAANLATSRRDAPSHHPLPPWLMNGMLLVVAPLMATCAIIPAIFAALTFDQLMDVALDITASLRRNAATYTPTSAAESGRLIQALLADIGVQLHSFNDTFWYRLRVQTGVSLTIAAILFLVRFVSLFSTAVALSLT